MFYDDTKQCLGCWDNVKDCDNFCERCREKIVKKFLNLIPNEDFYNDFYDFDKYGSYDKYLNNDKFYSIAAAFDEEDEWAELWQIIDGCDYTAVLKKGE